MKLDTKLHITFFTFLLVFVVSTIFSVHVVDKLPLSNFERFMFALSGMGSMFFGVSGGVIMCMSHKENARLPKRGE